MLMTLVGRISLPEGLRVVPNELVDARFRFYLVDVLDFVEVPLLPDVRNGPALLGASYTRKVRFSFRRHVYHGLGKVTIAIFITGLQWPW
jgi:hypothetical protein